MKLISTYFPIAGEQHNWQDLLAKINLLLPTRVFPEKKFFFLFSVPLINGQICLHDPREEKNVFLPLVFSPPD